MQSTRRSEEIDALRSFVETGCGGSISAGSERVLVQLPHRAASATFALPEEYPCDQSNAQPLRILDVAVESLPSTQCKRIASVVERDACGNAESLITAVSRFEELLDSEPLTQNGETDHSHATRCDTCNSEERLLRTCAWTHHIFNANKKRHICQLADELGIAGLVKHGQPGIFIISGPESAVREYLCRIKQWKWRAFAVRDEEQADSSAFEFNKGIRVVPDTSDSMEIFKRECSVRGLERFFYSALQLDSNVK